MKNKSKLCLAVGLAILGQTAGAAVITGVSIDSFSSELGAPFDRKANYVVSGAGFDAVNGFHGTAPDGNMWLSKGTFQAPNNPLPAVITFNLGDNYNLNSIRVWNYNEFPPGLTNRGANSVQILLASAAAGPFTSLGMFTFRQAPGTANTDFSQTIDMLPFPAARNTRFVRFNILSNYGDANQFAGLSEVRFDGTFAPPQIPVTNGLTLFLTAGFGVTTNASGAVMGWSDLSGNSNNAVQPTDSLAPLLVNGALNSRPVVRFDGVDDYLDVADSDSISITGDISSFFVVRFDDFATFRAVWGKTAGNFPAPTDIYTVPGSGVLRIYRGDGTAANLSSVDTAQPLRVNTYLVLGFTVASNTLTHYLNNVENGSGTVTLTTADGNTPLKIGSRGDLFTKLKGDMAELVIFNRALSATERSNVFNYMQAKYNLLNLLPTCTLTAAPAGTNVNVGDTITLNAAASDPDGTVAQVQFFANGSLLATAVSPPYSARVKMESAGAVSFSARATDNKGGFTDSATLIYNAAPAGSFSMTVTNGLQLWLKADAGTTLDGGGGVSGWTDQSGNGNNATQLDPTLTPILTNNAVNGQPALRFDGVNDYLIAADTDSLSITGNIASFWVTRFTDFATYRAVWGKTAVNIPAPTDIYTSPSSGILNVFRGNGTAFQNLTGARAYPAGSFILGGFDQAGTAMTHYLNGLPNGTGTITVPPGDRDGPLLVGSRADFVTRFKGEMSELFIYNRALPAAERRAVERYLTEKYGLPALLSATNTAPTVAITNPAGGVFQASNTINVMATASDPDGSVVSVQIFVDGALLGSTSAPPYRASWTPRYGGVYTLTAIATDNLGASRTSVPVPVCVQGPASPAGLVGYWPLDGNANASIGVNGIMVSNPVPTMDRNMMASGALAFDGALQQRVEVPGGGGLNGLTRGTIALWVKWSGPQDTGAASSAGAVLGRQQDGSFSDDIICLNNADPTIATLQWRQNSGTVSAAGLNAVGNGAWRHVAVTFTETNSQIFLDGNREVTGTGGLLHNNPATALAIGAWIGGGGAYATAAIDDVAIWNRVLADGELLVLGDPFSSVTPLTLLLQPDCITIGRSGPSLTLRWGSAGVLQSADQILGPWIDVPAAANPFTVTPSAAKKFYRLRSP